MNPIHQFGLPLSAFVADCLRATCEFERCVSGLCCLVPDAPRATAEAQKLRDAVYREGSRTPLDKATLDRIVRDSIMVAYHVAANGGEAPLESMHKAATLLMRAARAEAAGDHQTAYIARLAVKKLRQGQPIPEFPEEWVAEPSKPKEA